MDIRKAKKGDIEVINSLYMDARKFMAENGNAVQWNNNYPSLDDIKDDMEKDCLYVCEDNGEILGVFFYEFADDETYAVIKDGSWIDDSPYGVLHRIATKRGTNGIGAYCIDYAYNASGNLRIDTHEKNIPMRNLLKKLGFTECGIIYVREQSERIAYQKVKQSRF